MKLYASVNVSGTKEDILNKLKENIKLQSSDDISYCEFVFNGVWFIADKDKAEKHLKGEPVIEVEIDKEYLESDFNYEKEFKCTGNKDVLPVEFMRKLVELKCKCGKLHPEYGVLKMPDIVYEGCYGEFISDQIMSLFEDDIDYVEKVHKWLMSGAEYKHIDQPSQKGLDELGEIYLIRGLDIIDSMKITNTWNEF